MRIKSLRVSNYKNLKEFNLDFDCESSVDIFVGKNGTGKSNLFEAIIEIFRHIIEYDQTKSTCEFDYQIVYDINGRIQDITWRSGRFTINGKERKTIGQTQVPDNLLIYYSGHNTTVKDLISKYEESFSKKIIRAKSGESRFFIGIGSRYKELLLSIILSQPETCQARKYVCKRLSIKEVGSELKLVLRRPSYAKGNQYDIEFNDEADQFWKPEGITKTFLERLKKCISYSDDQEVRSEGYFSSEDYYILYFNLNRIRDEFQSEELFEELDNLMTLKMLTEIVIPVKLENGFETDVSGFSDGQFQSIYIYTIIEVFKKRNCITLLDEPDSFLHPEWQFDFLKQVSEITNGTPEKNNILMSSHSAATLANYEEKRVRLFCLDNNTIRSRFVHKKYAIDQLSSNLVKFNESEQILYILQSINIEKKPVLFTEGSTDPEIIKTAWGKLYSDPIPFIPIYAFNCVYLRHLLLDERIINELNKQPVFGLFDFDEAYNEWNYLNEKKSWKNVISDPYKGLITEWTQKNIHAIVIPVPKKCSEVEKLVIKNKTTGEHYAHKSRMGIEHIFYESTNAKSYFKKEMMPGDSELLVFKEKKKSDFAKKVVPNIDKKYFDPFQDIFKFIKNKCK